MRWICHLIGHNYEKHGAGEEKPYTGTYRFEGIKPHTRFLTFIYCKRCRDMQTLNNYFFAEQISR